MGLECPCDGICGMDSENISYLCSFSPPFSVPTKVRLKCHITSKASQESNFKVRHDFMWIESFIEHGTKHCKTEN